MRLKPSEHTRRQAMKALRTVVGCVVVSLLLSTRGVSQAASEADLRKELDQASQAFEQGRYEEARKAYEHVTQQDPGSIRGWTGLGWSLWQLGQRDRAMKIWNDLLKVSPNEPRILLALAQAHEQNGNNDEALAYYERVLKTKFEPHDAHVGRARVLERMGNPAAAEPDLKEALRLEPGDVSAQFELPRVHLAA